MKKYKKKTFDKYGIDTDLALNLLRDADFFVNPLNPAEIFVQYPKVDTLFGGNVMCGFFEDDVVSRYLEVYPESSCNSNLYVLMLQSAIKACEAEIQIYKSIKYEVLQEAKHAK